MGITERKLREKEKRAEDIISAAEKLFINNGLAKTTMDDIANKCELSKATLYLYFKSKDELLMEIILRALYNLYEHLSQAMEKELSGPDRLRVMSSSYLGFYREHPWYFKMINGMGEFSEHGHEDQKNFDPQNSTFLAILEKNKQVWDLCATCVIKGIEQGDFRPEINPLEIAVMMWSASNGIILLMDQIKQHENAFGNSQHHSPVKGPKVEEIYIRMGEYIIDSIVKVPEDAEKKRSDP